MLRASLSNPGRSIVVRRLLCAGVLLAFIGGCAKNKPTTFHPPAPQPHSTVLVDKPVLDFSRGGGGLPLERKTTPRSLGELVKALEQGYSDRLHFAPERKAVTVE